MFKSNNFQIDEYVLTFTDTIITFLLRLLLSFNFQFEGKLILRDQDKNFDSKKWQEIRFVSR